MWQKWLIADEYLEQELWTRWLPATESFLPQKTPSHQGQREDHQHAESKIAPESITGEKTPWRYADLSAMNMSLLRMGLINLITLNTRHQTGHVYMYNCPFFFLRKDTSLSVDDLLGQYSAGVKRRCPEIPLTAEPLTTHTSVSKEKGCDSTAGESRPRNRFATLLQWRNRSEEGTGEQGTRSRYKSMMGNLHK